MPDHDGTTRGGGDRAATAIDVVAPAMNAAVASSSMPVTPAPSATLCRIGTGQRASSSLQRA
jgi:hypothetical protein